MAKSKPESPNCKPGDGKDPGKPVEECPRGQLLVYVKDADGKPVENVDVDAGAWGKQKTDKDGLADFGKVAAGTHPVKAKKAGHAPKRGDPEGEDAKADVTVTDGSKTEVNLVQHPICANVAFFEGAKTRSKYYGFDHKTNRPATPGTDEYWLPTPAARSLTMPGIKQTRDGARWVSVAIGKETEVEINFAFTGSDCIPCITNSCYEVAPANIAEVVTSSINAKKATFKIKGKAAGEASLKVTCDGKDIGWFHIWCVAQVTIKVDVCNLVTTKAPATPFSRASLEAVFNDIFQQVAIKVNMKNLGDVDVSGNATLATTEATGYPAPDNKFDARQNVLTALHNAATASLTARPATEPKPRVGAYRVYRYVPTAGALWGGFVINIGSSPAFSFMTDGAYARNSTAHEFGHCLGLKHPAHDPGNSQFPAHNRSTVGGATPAYTATNTEPATTAKAAKFNVMPKDPTNLMGYWPTKPERKPIRYLQWKACKRS